jgi:hypothetical protein
LKLIELQDAVGFRDSGSIYEKLEINFLVSASPVQECAEYAVDAPHHNVE